MDFSYEVSRSLAACEGAVLLIDAAQGVEAQTVANAHLAFAQKLKVIPVINKIDLPSANLELCTKQLEDILTIPAEEAILASGKSGIGIEDILEAAVARVPPPRWTEYLHLRALDVFDLLYDTYRGVIAYARVFSGTIKAGDMMMLMSTGQKAEVKEVGVFTPKMEKVDVLGPGDVGYIVSSIKDPPSEVKTGDTITLSSRPATEMLPGYHEVSARWCSAGSTPSRPPTMRSCKAALGRLQLDRRRLRSLFAGDLGRAGLRLPLRLPRAPAHGDHPGADPPGARRVDIISTYPERHLPRALKHGGDLIEVDNPVNLPDPGTITEIREPTIMAQIHIPTPTRWATSSPW